MTSGPMSMPEKVNNAGKDYTAATVAVVLCAFSGILVFLRFAEKIRMHAFFAEDYTLIPGLLLYIATAVVIVRTNIDGAIGTPIQQVTYHQVEIVGQSAILLYWLYSPMSGFIRISILLFYRRLFSPTIPALRIVLWILIGVQVVFSIVCMILQVVGPRPIYRMWHLRDATGNDNTVDYKLSYNVGVSTYSINLALDVILLVLPLFPIASLRVPVRKRLGMAILFILGAGACFAAVWKLVTYLVELGDQRDPSRWTKGKDGVYIPSEAQSNQTHGTLNYFYATQLEPALALIGTSLPSIRHMICSIRKPSPQSSQEMEQRSTRRYHRRWLQLDQIPTSERALTTDTEQQDDIYPFRVEDDRANGRCTV